MVQLLLYDVRPDPVPVAGIGVLILLAFVILLLTAGVLIGLVLIIKRGRRKRTQEISPTAEPVKR